MRYSAARASPSRMWVKYVSSSALTEAISLSVEDKTGEERQFESAETVWRVLNHNSAHNKTQQFDLDINHTVPQRIK